MKKKAKQTKAAISNQKKQLIYKKIKPKIQSATYAIASFGYNTCSVP